MPALEEHASSTQAFEITDRYALATAPLLDSRAIPMRVVLAWRAAFPGAWIGWGRDRAVSAGEAGLRGSSLYWIAIGPARVGLIVPMTARQLAKERTRMAPALRNPELAVGMRKRDARRR